MPYENWTQTSYACSFTSILQLKIIIEWMYILHKVTKFSRNSVFFKTHCWCRPDKELFIFWINHWCSTMLLKMAEQRNFNHIPFQSSNLGWIGFNGTNNSIPRFFESCLKNGCCDFQWFLKVFQTFLIRTSLYHEFKCLFEVEVCTLVNKTKCV